MTGTLYITGDPEADALLNTDGNALLIGMLLDQQITMEKAFSGPAVLRTRLGHLDPVRIAAMTEDDVVAVCSQVPAIHRFPRSMGARVHQLCTVLAERYDGDATALWADVTTGDALYARLRELPGFGEEKSQIFVALLAKRMGITPRGWKTAAGKFGDTVPRSVADVHDTASLGKVREWKKAQKAAKKDKQDRPLT
jgi:uncharacterized HhH-GPD family protein